MANLKKTQPPTAIWQEEKKKGNTRPLWIQNLSKKSPLYSWLEFLRKQ